MDCGLKERVNWGWKKIIVGGGKDEAPRGEEIGLCG